MGARTRFDLAGASVLVTGASGFVGTHLRRALDARGAQMIGFGKETHAPAGFTRWCVGDLIDSGAVAAAVRACRPQAVVHLAGQASAGRSFQSPVETFEVNVAGTSRLLEAVAAHSPEARVLVVGSGEAYGPQPAGSRVAEEVPFRPVSPYAFSKAAADAIASAWSTHRGLDVVRTRSFSHTGAGQTPGFALPSWARQIAELEREARGGALRVGNLDVTRDLLDVRDVVECYALLLERGRGGEAYNVCRGAGVRLREVVGLLAGLSTVPVRIEVDPERVRPADVEYLVGDPAKTSAATGWSPSREIREVLVDLLAFWRTEQAPGSE